MKHLALLAAAGSMAAFAAPVQAAELPGAPLSLFAGHQSAPAAYGDDDWDDDDEDWDDEDGDWEDEDDDSDAPDTDPNKPIDPRWSALKNLN